MKQLFKSIICGLCLSLSFGLYSCSSGGTSSKSDDAYKVYSVHYEDSAYYTHGGTVNSTSGQTATIKLTSNYPAYEIVGCTYNGSDCTKGEDQGETKVFTFTMPSSDVDINVIGEWNDLLASGTNNFLSFDSSNNYTMKSAKNDENYNNDENWGSPLILVFNTNSGFMTIADITCFSTDENVLPSSAITVNKTLSKNSNAIVGGTIVIDRSKANAGSTKIVLRVKSGNNSSYDAVIVTTLTITE